jgi:hypothetical protein
MSETNEPRVPKLVELKDGRIWRDTRYFAESFEAPEWRAHLIERMDP